MRRPRRRLEVSTFPFLAVLLCAMGSLILLLLVLDRRAKAAARAHALAAARNVLARREAAARTAAEEAARRAAERADERERRRLALHEQLTRAREEVGGTLRSVRGRAADAARAAAAERERWRQLLEALGSQREELTKAERETAAGRGAADEASRMSDAARKEAARLGAQLRGLEVVLAELKAARQRDAQTYSLVPYRGKRGDSRRPLYVECTGNGLVFHPDKKALTRIATALDIRKEVESRIDRQREAVLAGGDKPDKKAYLLMLVRPDGIPCYYETLAALQGKEIDFGYEFIDAGWVLDFPAGDAAPAAQLWMAAQRTPVAPADPSAPTRKVTGLRPGRPGGAGGGEPGEGDGGGTGPAPARGGAADLPPLPGAPGGSDGSSSGGGRRVGATPGKAEQAPGGGGASGGGGAPDSDGSLPSKPPPVPGAVAQGPPGTAPGAPRPATGSPSGPPALFPWDRATQPRTGAGGQPSGTAGAGQPAGASGAGEPGAGAKAAQGGAARPHDPDEPQGPRLGTAPLPGEKPPPSPPPRPPRLIGNRDWVIPIECHADGAVLRGAGQKFPLTVLSGGTPGENALLQAVKQMIARRQASVRAGEPPYRPQVRFLIYPDGLRTYHLTFPVLEPLGVPLTRQNVDGD